MVKNINFTIENILAMELRFLAIIQVIILKIIKIKYISSICFIVNLHLFSISNHLNMSKKYTSIISLNYLC